MEASVVNQALFDSISAGIAAGDALAFVRTNAEAAVAGNADLGAVILGTTKIMNAYNEDVDKAARITETLFQTQLVTMRELQVPHRQTVFI